MNEIGMKIVRQKETKSIFIPVIQFSISQITDLFVIHFYLCRLEIEEKIIIIKSKRKKSEIPWKKAIIYGSKHWKNCTYAILFIQIRTQESKTQEKKKHATKCQVHLSISHILNHLSHSLEPVQEQTTRKWKRERKREKNRLEKQFSGHHHRHKSYRI